MTTDVRAAPAPSSATQSPASEILPGFEERWAAWQARGAARDRTMRRKMAFAFPLLLLAVAAGMYVLIGR